MREKLRKFFNALVVLFVAFTIFFSLQSGSIFEQAGGNVKNSAGAIANYISSKHPSPNLVDSNVQTDSKTLRVPVIDPNPTFVNIKHADGTTVRCQNPDFTLKNRVSLGQSQLATMAASINLLKDEIDKGRGEYDMTAVITVYNADIKTYQEKYYDIENLRSDYNQEVASFNACLTNR
jgi:hypothetical protein